MSQDVDNEGKIFAYNLLIVATTSVVIKTSTAPIERIKLILQNQDSSLQILQQQRKKYTGIIDCLIRIPREQGILSFWRGNVINIMRYFPTQALSFAFNDLIMTRFRHYFDEGGDLQEAFLKFAAGGLAGAFSITLLYPLYFCHTKITVDIGESVSESASVKREYSGIIDCIKKVYKNEGIIGPFKGYPVSLIAISLYRALYFGLFDNLKQVWSKEIEEDTQKTKLPLLLGVVFAQTATCVSNVSTYPMDTLARRVMLDSGRPECFRLFNGVLDAASKIYRLEGLRAFYNGAGTNCLRNVSGALVLVFYDEFLYYTSWKKYISPCDTCI